MDASPRKPEIPARQHLPARRRRQPGSRRAVIPPANPEVISNLITSLDALTPDDAASANSSSRGSFGVDYGAYVRPAEPQPELDNLAASPPVIRTSKPTSGFSPLASPSSAASSTKDSRFRSLMRGASRPSSAGSNDDASIGNLSIERPAPRLRHHRSHDSWGSHLRAKELQPLPSPVRDDMDVPVPVRDSSLKRKDRKSRPRREEETIPETDDESLQRNERNPHRDTISAAIEYMEFHDSAPSPAVGRRIPASNPKKRDSGPLSPRSESRMSVGSHDADSIDGEVQAYLRAPRLTQKVRHPQTGRVISFSEVGDPEGSAVFCCVGMGLTRYITAFYDELALTLKLRLITPDRPGVGDSEPYTDGATTPLGWPDDVYAICQALKITKFSILAHSAGAIYALATALRMPQHIRGRIHLLAPWIPPSQMNVFGTSQSPPTSSIPTSQKILRALPTPFLKAANSSFMSATSTSITSSLPKTPKRSKRKSAHRTPDLPEPQAQGQGQGQGQGQSQGLGIADLPVPELDRIPPMEHDDPDERQATYDTRLTHAIWDMATTGANPAVDLLVCLERRHTIGFRYVDITRPVVIHHGSKDTRVPVENVKWLGKAMRRCEVRVLEGEGHGLMASANVMGAILMEMSKEWEDWMRVTGASRRKSTR